MPAIELLFIRALIFVLFIVFYAFAEINLWLFERSLSWGAEVLYAILGIVMMLPGVALMRRTVDMIECYVFKTVLFLMGLSIWTGIVGGSMLGWLSEDVQPHSVGFAGLLGAVLVVMELAIFALVIWLIRNFCHPRHDVVFDHHHEVPAPPPRLPLLPPGPPPRLQSSLDLQWLIETFFESCRHCGRDLMMHRTSWLLHEDIEEIHPGYLIGLPAVVLFRLVLRTLEACLQEGLSLPDDTVLNHYNRPFVPSANHYYMQIIEAKQFVAKMKQLRPISEEELLYIEARAFWEGVEVPGADPPRILQGALKGEPVEEQRRDLAIQAAGRLRSVATFLMQMPAFQAHFTAKVSEPLLSGNFPDAPPRRVRPGPLRRQLDQIVAAAACEIARARAAR